MNVCVEDHDPLWLDFKCMVTEWKKDEEDTNSFDNTVNEDNAFEIMPEDMYFLL